MYLAGGEAARDVASARGKLEAIVSRASAVEEKVAITGSKQQEEDKLQEADERTLSCKDTPIFKILGSEQEDAVLGVPLSGPLVYSTLSELLQCVEAENRLRMARIQNQLLRFCTEVVLPKYQLTTQHQ